MLSVVKFRQEGYGLVVFVVTHSCKAIHYYVPYASYHVLIIQYTPTQRNPLLARLTRAHVYTHSRTQTRTRADHDNLISQFVLQLRRAATLARSESNKLARSQFIRWGVYYYCFLFIILLWVDIGGHRMCFPRAGDCRLIYRPRQP